MSLSINEPVSVTLMYNHYQHKTVPMELIWNHRHYPITKVGLHHTYQEGDKLKHLFSVTSHQNFFELIFDAKDLTWRLKASDVSS